MGFCGTSAEGQKLEFVRLALEEGIVFSALCRRYRVSRTCGYKWQARYAAGGAPGSSACSATPRPPASTSRTPA